jgi:hypothetical protein
MTVCKGFEVIKKLLLSIFVEEIVSGFEKVVFKEV